MNQPSEKERTARDFVRELCLRGRRNSEIRAIALCTRWKNEPLEVEKWIEKRAKEWRQKGRERRTRHAK